MITFNDDDIFGWISVRCNTGQESDVSNYSKVTSLLDVLDKFGITRDD